MSNHTLRTPQQRGCEVCPNGCYPGLIMPGIPRVVTPAGPNAVARCLQCLGYWEVTPRGEIVNRRQGLDVDFAVLEEQRARLEGRPPEGAPPKQAPVDLHEEEL